MKGVNPAYYSLPFLLAFGLSAVMLLTDTNLRIDFGAIQSGYYSHWYVVLVMGLADLVGPGLLLATRSRTSVKLGVLGSGPLFAIWVGDIFTYSQGGFGSATSFANYLFEITYYGGDVRYLYDAILAVYLITFLLGLTLLLTSRPGSKAPTQAWVGAGSKPPSPPA
ncbi:MAG: hypothetical protein L3J95_02330 [Thermoplasmata archaeon]|nr:hypothetical protein [Thermoplasmata archaeon]MCI4359244.1 hypothetical protein [Thermoplasmata archaeon]